jgi:non-ribosomal peptide synthetase component F
LPAAELHNEYGPSEATVWATAGLLAGEHGGADSQSPVTIGRPIPSSRVYLLDDRSRPVPIGSVGEICIGGSIVASGYLGSPEETARRVVDDPFCAGGRLYRTGDQGRFLEDGRIEFLGRQDHQVKIRGFRVEVEEIEHSLLQHPAVRDAVVSFVPPALDTRPTALADGLARLSDADVERLLASVEKVA